MRIDLDTRVRSALQGVLEVAGFKEIKCCLDWEKKPPKKPKAEWLVFVSRKH